MSNPNTEGARKLRGATEDGAKQQIARLLAEQTDRDLRNSARAIPGLSRSAVADMSSIPSDIGGVAAASPRTRKMPKVATPTTTPVASKPALVQTADAGPAREGIKLRTPGSGGTTPVIR